MFSGFRGTVRDRKFSQDGPEFQPDEGGPAPAPPTTPTIPFEPPPGQGPIEYPLGGETPLVPPETSGPEYQPQLPHGGPAEQPLELETPPSGELNDQSIPPPPMPGAVPNTSVAGTFASPANPASLSTFRTPQFGVNRSTGGPTEFGPGSAALTGDGGNGSSEYEELLRRLRGGK